MVGAFIMLEERSFIFMGLRIYMKSGNDYYIDVSEYGYEEIHDILISAINYKNLLTIDAYEKSYFILSQDIEYFELDKPKDYQEVKRRRIGFNN